MIRRIEEKDLEAILELENDLFSSPWSKEQFLYEINQNEFSCIYLEENDHEIIAYGGYWLLFDKADITVLAVNRKYQMQGYGEKMLRYLLDDIKQKEAEFVFLEVRASNKRAINLYHKLGFEDLRIRKAYYDDNHEDAIEMMKGLI